MNRTIHKPIIGPSVVEWDEDVRNICQHGIPHCCQCLVCEDIWLNLALWGELLDEA